MKYQKTLVDEKQALLSAVIVPTTAFINKLETYNFEGGPSHVHAKVEKINVVIYAPDKLQSGIETLLRILIKRVNDKKYHKIILIPDSDHLDEGLRFDNDCIVVRQIIRLVGGCPEAEENWCSLFKDKEPDDCENIQ